VTLSLELHRLTSFAPASFTDDWDWILPADPRLRRDFAPLDAARFPWFHKRYDPSLPRVPLPRELPRVSAPAIAVLAGTVDAPHRRLDLAHLSRLLHLSAGVVRTMEWSQGTWLFRAAGSAGGRFPLELYVAVPDGSEVAPGMYWYHPVGHALVRIGPPPRGGEPAVVVTGVPWRTAWKYRERGFRHVYWDAGTMLSQLLAVADSAGLAPALYTRFPDDEVAALVGADGVHEWPVAVVGLGDGMPAIAATATAETGMVDADPLELPLVTSAQHAGDTDRLGAPWDRGDAAAPSVEGGLSIDDAVLARSSQRRMDPGRGLSSGVLRTAMDVSLRGVAIPHYVVVNDVEGWEPGVYRWPAPDPVRSGVLRDELYRVASDQGLPRDASFVVIGAADLRELDDREHREALLAAGLVEGRLHLAAYALGATASGMTFIDSEVPALLGERVDALLFTCVGVPEYTPRPGGPPGSPTRVRRVEPRL
jgi:hypothetical protein